MAKQKWDDRGTGVLTLRNGGYRTMTTRGRINECLRLLDLPLMVWADRGKDYVSGPDGRWARKGATEFVDGAKYQLARSGSV